MAQNEGCGIGDVKDFDPSMKMWWEVDCELIGVYGNAEAAKSGYEPNYDLSANPGAHEIKCLAGGKLARVVKFTVGKDGSFDDGLARANNFGSDRAIVPVEVRLADRRLLRTSPDRVRGAAVGGALLTGPR